MLTRWSSQNTYAYCSKNKLYLLGDWGGTKRWTCWESNPGPFPRFQMLLHKLKMLRENYTTKPQARIMFWWMKSGKSKYKSRNFLFQSSWMVFQISNLKKVSFTVLQQGRCLGGKRCILAYGINFYRKLKFTGYEFLNVGTLPSDALPGTLARPRALILRLPIIALVSVHNNAACWSQ